MWKYIKYTGNKPVPLILNPPKRSQVSVEPLLNKDCFGRERWGNGVDIEESPGGLWLLHVTMGSMYRFMKLYIMYTM